MTNLKIFYCDKYLYLLDEVDEPLLGDLLGREDLGGEGLGDDGDDPGQVGVVGPEDVLVVALDQVRQEPVHVRRLVHVLSHRQPREPAAREIFQSSSSWERNMLILFLPYGQNLVHVDLAVVVLQDLGDCADRVLCRVDVLRLPALGLGDNLQRKVKLRWC